MKFEDSYLGKLRKVVGTRLLHVPGARAILENDKGEILLQLRSDFKTWGLPAGSPEEGNDILETIKREVFEETGLKVYELKVFGFASHSQYESIEYRNGDRTHNYSLCFCTRKWKGKLIDSNTESLQLQFFHPSQFPELLPNHERTINAYLNFKNSGDFQFL